RGPTASTRQAAAAADRAGTPGAARNRPQPSGVPGACCVVSGRYVRRSSCRQRITGSPPRSPAIKASGRSVVWLPHRPVALSPSRPPRILHPPTAHPVEPWRIRMLRLFTSACLVLALTSAPALAQTPASTPATEADVQTLLGDWTISGESQMGPFVVALKMAVAEGKPVATLSSEVQAPTEITDITKSGEDLVLTYWFDYE